MLMLDRKKDESITFKIPGLPDMEIIVKRIRPSRVSIAIRAHDSVKVVRTEILNEENK